MNPLSKDGPNLQSIPMPGTPEDLERREAIRRRLVKAFTGPSPRALGGVSFDVSKKLYEEWANLFVGYSPLIDVDYATLEREWAAKIAAACPVGSKRRVCMALHNANARIHE